MSIVNKVRNWIADWLFPDLGEWVKEQYDAAVKAALEQDTLNLAQYKELLDIRLKILTEGMAAELRRGMESFLANSDKLESIVEEKLSDEMIGELGVATMDDLVQLEELSKRVAALEDDVLNLDLEDLTSSIAELNETVENMPDADYLKDQIIDDVESMVEDRVGDAVNEAMDDDTIRRLLGEAVKNLGESMLY